MAKFQKGLLIGIWMALILAACSTTTATTVATTAPTLPPTVSIPTNTPIPTNTSSPTSAPTITPEPTTTFTLIPTENLAPDFQNMKVLSGELRDSGLYIIRFYIPNLREVYQVLINEQPFICALEKGHDFTLSCSGPKFPINTKGNVSFYQPGANKAAFVTSFILPPDQRVAAGTPEYCIVRGQNLTCDTEIRQEWNGACMAQTCVDLCGWYSSVNTCDALESTPKP